MGYKKIQLTFNLDNKMQAELYDKCIEEFGSNLAGGVKNILSLYFNGALTNSDSINKSFIPQKQENIDKNNIFSSVL